MSKIKIKTLLKSDEKTIKNECLGIIVDDNIRYKDDSVDVILSLNKNNIVLKRVNSEFELNLDFFNKTGSYHLKEYNLKMDLDIILFSLELNESEITIKYDLYSNKEKINSCEFYLDYEVIS